MTGRTDRPQTPQTGANCSERNVSFVTSWRYSRRLTSNEYRACSDTTPIPKRMATRPRARCVLSRPVPFACVCACLRDLRWAVRHVTGRNDRPQTPQTGANCSERNASFVTSLRYPRTARTCGLRGRGARPAVKMRRSGAARDWTRTCRTSPFAALATSLRHAAPSRRTRSARTTRTVTESCPT